MSHQKVAVVGCNGFIGKHLCNLLLNEKTINCVFFGKSNTAGFKTENYYQINLLNNETYLTALSNTDCVYYLASETIPISSWENPLIEVEKNLLPFLTFMETACRVGVKKVIYLSSAGTVYGTKFNKVSENEYPMPFSPYGINKISIENYLRYYSVKYGIDYLNFRISNVYGPGQDTSKGLGLINTFLENIINKKTINVFGDGSNLRNYVFVKDVAVILAQSLNFDSKKETTYNLASNDTLKITEIIDIIQKHITSDFETNFSGKRTSDNAAINLDNNLLLNTFKDFNFTPIITGIKETYNHLLNQ